MASKKNKVRTFKRMKYRQVQRKNSRNKKLLSKEQVKWLKDNSYRNVGWNNVIDLFNKIQELQQQNQIKSSTLEELFIEADRIGNKYLDSKEINRRNLAIARELNQIADIMEEQYPDNTVEVIDYGKKLTRTRKS